MVGVEVTFTPAFRRLLSRIKDSSVKRRIRQQIAKIRANPNVGKPLSHHRRGTRELRVKPFRLSYQYLPAHAHVYLLDLYHKKKQ